MSVEEKERQAELDAKERALAYDKSRALGASMKRTPGDPFSFTEVLDSADQSLPPVGGGVMGMGLPSIGKGGRGNFQLDDEYKKKMKRELDAFNEISEMDQQMKKG